MPSASKDPTPNVAAHAEGKPFRLADFFSTLLEPQNRPEQPSEQGSVNMPG